MKNQRWCVVKEKLLYYFDSKTSKKQKGQIPLDGKINILFFVFRITRKCSNSFIIMVGYLTLYIKVKISIIYILYIHCSYPILYCSKAILCYSFNDLVWHCVIPLITSYDIVLFLLSVWSNRVPGRSEQKEIHFPAGLSWKKNILCESNCLP